jgi:hypothetical protein
MKRALLFAPAEYWRLTPDQHADFCNGCGSNGAGWLVPDSLLGVCVTEACDIHDYMYTIGQTIEDKDRADRVLRNNLLILIDEKSTRGPLRWLRRKMAIGYYDAVHDFGGPAFWAGKNPDETLGRLELA